MAYQTDIVNGVISNVNSTNGGTSTRLIIGTINSDGVYGSSLRGQRARGEVGNLSGVIFDDVLLQLAGDGYVSGHFASGKASLVFKTADEWTDVSTPTYCIVRTTPIGSTDAIERLRIWENGYVGIGSHNPLYPLDVSGEGNFSQALYVGGSGVALNYDLIQSGVALGGQISDLSGYGGDLYATKIALTNSGIIIYGDLSLLSGFLSSGIASTGSASIAAANVHSNSVGTTISGNLTQTGVALGSKVDSLSGFTATVVSGGLEARIRQTGAAAISYAASYANSVGSVLSGNLTQTGATLGSLIVSTGTAAVNYTNSVGTSISGSLTQTGVALGNKIDALSGSSVSASNLASTGQQLYNLVVGGDTNLSGNLYQTGATLLQLIGASSAGVSSLNSASGVLSLVGAGNVGIGTNGQTITISGTGASLAQLALTGSTLDSKVNALSGYSASAVNLTQTGATLGAKVDSLSGFVGNVSGGLETRIFQTGAAAVSYATTYANSVGVNLSGNLTQTGVALGAKVNALSGFTTNASGGLELRIAQTGAAAVSYASTYANSVGTNLSGNLTQTGVTLGSLIVSTGNAAVVHANGIGSIISGNLTSTGSTLWARDLGISGALVTGITATGSAALSAAIAYANGMGSILSGNMTQTGVALASTIVSTGNAAVAHANGVGTALSGNLTLTGQTLQGRITSLSGFVGNVSGGLEVRVFQTGAASVAYANTVGTNLSGSLTQTGVSLGSTIVSTGNAAVAHANGMGSIISGNLTQTGVTLLVRDLVISGTLVTGIASTGAAALSAAQAYTNGMGTILSGNLTQTGVVLGSTIISSGNAAVAHANGIGSTLSGNLTQTGVTLGAQISSLSGFTLNASGALQAQMTAGGTNVRVTGSANITVADFTGIGGTLVFSSGGQIFISGGAGSGPAGGVTSLNTLTDSVVIVGAAGISVSLNGQNIVVSGDTSISGVLTQTGVALGAKIDSLSGFTVTVVSGGLETRIVQTGNAAVQHANGIGSTLSGNLTTTGVTLGAKVDSLSGFVGNVSGGLEARIVQTGNSAVTHANGIGVSLSGNLTTTGVTLGAKVDSLSGFVGNVSGGLEARITQTGNSAVAHSNGIGVTLSGNLSTTGATLGATIISSGNSAVAHANGIGTITSGNLTLTGQTLQGRITSLSGFVGNVSGGLETRIFQTGAAAVTASTTYTNSLGSIISGNLAATGATLWQRDLDISGAIIAQMAAGGSVVKVSGSAAIATADFTGIGGVKVFSSGGQVFISGSEGGVGGGVTSLNSLAGTVDLVGTGGMKIATAGQQIIIGPPPFRVPLSVNAVTATNATLAPQFFANSSAYATYVDLAGYTGVRFVLNKAATAGAANYGMFLRYLGNFTTTAASYLPITSPEMRVAGNLQNTMIVSGFLPIVAAARSGIYLALISSGNDGALDPVWGNISADFL